MAKEHCIQVRVDEDEWERAIRAAKANGLPTVSSLCRFLLHREYDKWGLLADPSGPVRRAQKVRRRAKRQRGK